MSVRIMTDSASDLTLEELREMNVELIPMPLSCGDETIIDDKTTAIATIWEMLISGTDIKTSQPSPDTFLSHFREAREAGDQVLCVLVSSGLSGTCQGAAIAKSMLDDEGIYIVDTLEVTASEKMLVCKACQLRDEGYSAAGIASKLEECKERTRLFACIDTLEYLVRGGRLSKTAGAVGTALQLKPIVSVTDEGLVEVEKKTLGIKRATKDLVQLIMNRGADSNELAVPLYAYDDANCLKFLESLKEAGFSAKLSEPMQIGSTVGVHIGPGGFGLAFMEDEK